MEIQRIVRITPTNRSKSIFTVSFSAPLIKFLTSNENGIPVAAALVELSSGEVVEVNLQHNKAEFTGAAQVAGSSLFSTTTRLEFNHKNLGWDVVIGDNNVI